jgi:hypothetical protein
MKDANAPKRGLSAYMLFTNKNRPSMVKDNPDCGMIEISQLLAKMWNDTSEKSRSPYMTQAARAKTKYDKEMEKYRETDSYVEFQKKKNTHDVIARFASKIPGVKKKLVYKIFPADPNQPKKPTTAYFLFAADQRANIVKKNPDASLGQIGKIIGEKWGKASSTVKAKYNKKHDSEKQKYERALAKYQSTSKSKEYLSVRQEYLAFKKSKHQSTKAK